MDAISALMDGELDADDARRQVAILKEDRTLRARWDEFHVIGDAMRGEALLSPQFDEILSRRLAAEPTVLSPRRLPSRTKRLTTYAMSAAASVAGVAFVGWMALGPTAISINDAPRTQAKASTPDNTDAGRSPSEQLAGSPLPPEAPVQNVSSDGSLNELMLAHQGFSPSTALWGIGSYIRSVSTASTTGR